MRLKVIRTWLPSFLYDSVPEIIEVSLFKNIVLFRYGDEDRILSFPQQPRKSSSIREILQ